MGLMTKFVIGLGRRLLGYLFCSKHLLPTNVSEREKLISERALLATSLVFDLFDWTNFALDFTFCVKLFQLPDSILYAVFLLIGLILGRIVVLRGSALLFRGGIHWSPFWIAPQFIQTPRKYRNVFPQLYCLVFSEAAVFLLEDYPSLSIYAHWVTINRLPAPLEEFDNVNIGFSLIMLCLLLALFVVAIGTSMLRLTWHEWSRQDKAINSCKIVVFIVLFCFLVWYIFREVKGAIDFAFRGVREIPSNKIAGIEFCEEITEFKDRHDFCDEESFLIHVAVAWIAAFYFAFYVLFRPASAATFMDVEDDKRMQTMRTIAASALSVDPASSTKKKQSRPTATTAAAGAASNVDLDDAVVFNGRGNAVPAKQSSAYNSQNKYGSKTQGTSSSTLATMSIRTAASQSTIASHDISISTADQMNGRDEAIARQMQKEWGVEPISEEVDC